MRKGLRTILTAFLVCLLLVGAMFPAAVPARAEEASASQVYGWNLVLADEIAVNFWVDIADTVSADAVMNVTDGYATTAYPIAEAERNAAGQYLFTAHLAAAQLADTITLELVSDGQIVSTEQYKAVDYASTVLAGDYSTETKELVGAMLHYGAAAQTYFDYNTDNLANAGLTAGEVDMPQWTETAIVSGSVSGVRFYGASLVFDSRVAVRFYFKAESLINVSFGTYTPVEKNGMYYVEIPGINPQDYDKAVSLTVTDGSEEMTVSYSPMAYILRKYAASEDGALKNLTAAMYQYHNAAKTYLAANGGVITDGNGIVIEQVIIRDGLSSAVVPAGTQLEENVTTLTLSATPMEETGSDVTVGENEQMVSLDVHIAGISADNTVPVIVTLDQLAPEFLNQGNIRMYHVEDGVTVEMIRVYSLDALDAHNEYYYDIATGTVTVAMASFSEIVTVANEENLWNGNVNVAWYNDTDTKFEIFNADQLAGLGKLVDDGNTFEGKTVTMLANINLKGYQRDTEGNILQEEGKNVLISFNPIGYSYEKINNGKVFKGTFDGNGNTISNLYQNGWALGSDYSYSMAGGGLFASIVNATIKNLTMDNANIVMECVDMGIVVGYANGVCNFENIIVKNSTIQNYNRCTGGVIGEIGGGGKYTLTNVDVEASTTISALWGTFDPPMGGLIGGKWGEAGSRGEGDGTTKVSVTMKNCDVACKIDAFNDVTSAYQWYSYRRAGMLIGDTEECATVNGRTEATASWLETENCTVSYGDWVNYTYCEFKDTTSLDARYPWVRVQAGLSNSSYSNPRYGRPTFADHKVVDWDNHKAEEHIDGDGHEVAITFHQLYGGGQGCYGGNTHVDLNLGVTEINARTPVEKFVVNENFNNIIATGSTITLGELFGTAELKENDPELQMLDVIAFVSPATEADTVRASFDKKNDWTQSSLTFSGLGKATITITDYYFCTPTTIEVTIEDKQPVDKFVAKKDVTANAGQAVQLGDIFSAVEGADIDSTSVVVTVTGGTYTPNTSDWTQSTIVFETNGGYTVTITDNNLCNVASNTVTVNLIDAFDIALDNTDDYLYRVGNLNEFNLSSVFKNSADDNQNLGDITVIVERINNTATYSERAVSDAEFYTYTAGSGFKDAKLDFSDDFTGPIKVTIQGKYTSSETLILEVVNAKNITKAESATANNVVLLDDISGTFTVSNGYTFYGNGFTVTLPTASVQNVGNGFTGYISIGASQDDGIANGGHLDNVRIEGPVYPEMYIYRDQAKITDTSDADYGDGYNMRYFKNSVIVYGGNVTISNCYISGSRTALCLRGGNNVVIENTTLSGGAYANMQICAGSSVTLRDITTVQVDAPDSYGKGKTAHGLGIAVDSAVVDIYIEGDLNQYNWLNETTWDAQVPREYQSSFPDFFGNEKYKAYWHYLNGGTDKYVNLAFIFACNWDTEKIHDDRTEVDYVTEDSTIAGVSGGVYSKVNTLGGDAITGADIEEPEYTPSGFNPVAPVLNFDNTPNEDADDTSDANDTYCVYNEANGTLKIGVTGDSKTIDLSKVTVTKDGANLTYTTWLNGTQISGSSVTIKAADGAKQTLKFEAFSDNMGYDENGNPLEGTIKYEWTVTVEIAVLSYPAPVWNMGGTYEFDTQNCYYAYYQTSQGYGEAVPIYEGIKVNYYDKTGKLVELDLSGTTTLPTGSNNSNSNAFTYTLSDGSTLTMKFSSGWKSGATTHQFTTYEEKVYIYPQSLDNDNYVRAKKTNQDFDVKITYTFTDPNGQSTDSQTMRWYNAKASNDSVSAVQWKTFDATNGKKECLTPDTLVTLADGSQVRVDSLTGNEELLVWNMVTGQLDSAPILFVDSDPETEYEIIHLYFSDGTDVKVIYEHGFWDYDLNRYVYLDANAAQYIGHTFAKQNGDILEAVTLTDVVLETVYTSAWSPVTAEHLCYFVNGMLSMPGGVGGLFNIFEVNPETMTYDPVQMQQDMEVYGLFTYEELASYAPALTEKMFDECGGAYLKISIGKGNMTMDELVAMINRYSKFF